ncbi:MAG TPA: vWA domain-containing protein, partial [Gemmataceae bacterium]
MRSVRPPHVGRVGGAAPAPPLRVESLEDRTTPATLYVITHGLQGTDSPPAWVFDLAEAIDARTGNRFSTDQINASVLRATDPPGSGVPPGGAADFLIFDWASLSRSAGTADDPEVAGALANFVRNRLPASGFQDVHFIGHGRGALVNSAAAALLNNPADNARIGRLQVTLLDPQALGADGQTGGSLTLTPNVDWADAFFQTGAVIPGGARVSVPSAAPLDITAQLQAWSGRSGTLADHEEVHDWYHWTVDLADTVQAPYLRDAALQAQKALFTAQAQGGGSGPNVRDLLYGENVDLDLDGSPDSLFGGSGIGFHFSVGQALGAQSLAGFGSLDLVLVIDATSSMFDDIEAVRRAASELVSTLRLHVPDFRLGIVTYRDLPQAPFGAPGDYQSRTDLAFTNETQAILDALNGLRIGGGGDTAESVYSGLVRAIDGGPDLGGWRNGVRRAIVLMGDAPPHDPEPGTGFTRQSVTVRAIEQGISIST